MNLAIGAGLVLWLHATCPTPLPEGMAGFADMVVHDMPAREVRAMTDVAGRTLLKHSGGDDEVACLKGRMILVTAMVGSLNATAKLEVGL